MSEDCENPCHPNSGCEDCEAYWQLMISEGYWDEDAAQWTSEGMKWIANNAKMGA